MGCARSLGAGTGLWPLGWGFRGNLGLWEEKQEQSPGLGFKTVLRRFQGGGSDSENGFGWILGLRYQVEPTYQNTGTRTRLPEDGPASPHAPLPLASLRAMLSRLACDPGGPLSSHLPVEKLEQML